MTKKQFNKVQSAQPTATTVTSNTNGEEMVKSVSLRTDSLTGFMKQIGLDVDSIGSVSKQSAIYTGMLETFEELVAAMENGADELEIKQLRNSALIAATLYHRVTGSYAKRNFETAYETMQSFNTQTYDGLRLRLRKVVISAEKLNNLRKEMEGYDFVRAVQSGNIELIKKALELILDTVRAYDMFLQQHIDAFKKAYDNVMTIGNVAKHGGTVELTKKLNTIRVQNNLKNLELSEDEQLIGNVVIQAHATSIEKNNKLYVSGSLNKVKQTALTEKVPELLNMLVKVAQSANMPEQVIDIAIAAIKKNPMLASSVAPIADLIRSLKEEADEDYRLRIQDLDLNSEDSEQLLKDERAKSQKKFLEIREIALSWLAVLGSKTDMKDNKQFYQLTHAELNAVVSVLGSHFPSDIGTGSNELAVSMAQRVFLYRDLHHVILESVLKNKAAYGVANIEDSVIAEQLGELKPILGPEYNYFEYMETKAIPSELAQTIVLKHGAKFEFVDGKNEYFANTMKHDGVYELCIIDPLTDENPSKSPKFKLMIETTSLFEKEIQRQITDFGNRYLVTFPLDARDLKDSHRYVKDENGKIYVERSEEVKRIDAFNEAIQKDTNQDRLFFTLDMSANGSSTIYALYSVNADFRENGIQDIRIEFTLNPHYSNIKKYLDKDQESNFAAKIGSNIWIDPIYVAYSQSKDNNHQRGSFVGMISESAPNKKLTLDERNDLSSAILAMPEHAQIIKKREFNKRAKSQDEVLEVQEKQEEFLNRYKPGMASFAQPKKKVTAQVKTDEELLLEQKNRELLAAKKQEALTTKVTGSAASYNPFDNSDDDDDDEL